MNTEQFIHRLYDVPESIEFAEVIAFVDDNYEYSPTAFYNGVDEDDQLLNEAGSNEGSCKIFALGQLLMLDEEHLLACFGRFYRDDVLANPDGDDHRNIRNFMAYGWGGIHFLGEALRPKGQATH